MAREWVTVVSANIFTDLHGERNRQKHSLNSLLMNPACPLADHDMFSQLSNSSPAAPDYKRPGMELQLPL